MLLYLTFLLYLMHISMNINYYIRDFNCILNDVHKQESDSSNIFTSQKSKNPQETLPCLHNAYKHTVQQPALSANVS